MRLTMQERKKAAAVIAVRYQIVRKKEKGVILDEFTELTGYGRRYASYVLRSHGRKVRINETTVVQGD
ncbi:MAG: transposase, partial [Nitrospirae bacterium]|nr:transposase [Nitrospirota bacterium]